MVAMELVVKDHLISISCWVLLKVLSDPLSKIVSEYDQEIP